MAFGPVARAAELGYNAPVARSGGWSMAKIKVAKPIVEIDPKLSMEELAERCVPSAEVVRIVIDGSDPSDYRLKAA